MAAAAKAFERTRARPAPNSDFYDVHATLYREELSVLKQVCPFMETRGVLAEAGDRSVEQLAKDENERLVGLLALRAQPVHA